MSKRIPCEDDLNSSNHETFAQAAMQCQHLGAFCIQDGYCHFNGDCFVKKNLSPEEMIQEMQFMKDELRDARSKLVQIESKLVRLISQLEDAKQRALKDGKSERVFALRHCLSFLKIGGEK